MEGWTVGQTKHRAALLMLPTSSMERRPGCEYDTGSCLFHINSEWY